MLNPLFLDHLFLTFPFVGMPTNHCTLNHFSPACGHKEENYTKRICHGQVTQMSSSMVFPVFFSDLDGDGSKAIVTIFEGINIH